MINDTSRVGASEEEGGKGKEGLGVWKNPLGEAVRYSVDYKKEAV